VVRQVARIGPKFAQKGLVAAPAAAYMSTASDIASRLCLETSGIDTLEILSMFKACHVWSTQTIFAVIPTEGVTWNKPVQPWPERRLTRSSRPAASKPSSHCRGRLSTSCVVQDHPQIVNVKTLGGLLDRKSWKQ